MQLAIIKHPSLDPDPLESLGVLLALPVLRHMPPDEPADATGLRVHRAMEEAELLGVAALQGLDHPNIGDDGVFRLEQDIVQISISIEQHKAHVINLMSHMQMLTCRYACLDANIHRDPQTISNS
jgi:hypothetical protein